MKYFYDQSINLVIFNKSIVILQKIPDLVVKIKIFPLFDQFNYMIHQLVQLKGPKLGMHFDQILYLDF